ncbi:MAG: YHYH protein [Verrucomicrobia bacterium]|jgi:hypothetical protein|nr:YHYH protein [Verrucomicrobiota bacterium]MDA0723805.1 YHYH protein [Verrucomicrobiota bacterium]MDA1046428.1 YHYH protein [Verrucomicrobiota bacterium]
MRKHTITQKKEWHPVPARKPPRFESKSTFEKGHKEIKVEANGIPRHKVGRFPNRGNPHTISEQAYDFVVRANQQASRNITPLHNDTGFGPPNTPFGIAINGVLFDPGTAEFYNGDRRSDWNYEALSGAVPLGVDANNAHVQPNGAYHYHGLPKGLLEALKVNDKEHSPLIGYAMDGYPIYSLYGFKDPKDSKSLIEKLKSSYKFKKGMRPRSARDPGGKYDGTFAKDYEYVEGAGDLDECNGRFTITAEYPEGTYAYFLTEGWPVIPRNFKATPLKLRGGPPHSDGHRHRPPPRPRRFP